MEPNPRVRLAWLADTAEICMRWVAAATVAEVAADHDGRLPDLVAHRVAHLIERPTLGADAAHRDRQRTVRAEGRTRLLRAGAEIGHLPRKSRKFIFERSSQAAMDRTTLLLPALCGEPDRLTLANALAHASHSELVAWNDEQIRYTRRKKRAESVATDQSHEAGDSSLE